MLFRYRNFKIEMASILLGLKCRNILAWLDQKEINNSSNFHLKNAAATGQRNVLKLQRN